MPPPNRRAGRQGSASSNNGAVSNRNAMEVHKVFSQTVSELKKSVSDMQHKSAVDVRLDFKSVNVDSKGILVWSKKTENKLEISLATRILPDE